MSLPIIPVNVVPDSWADYIIPLACAILGGLVTYWGIRHTIKHESALQRHDYIERIRPFIIIDDYIGTNNRPNKDILLLDDSESGKEKTMVYRLRSFVAVNAGDAAFIINYIAINGEKFNCIGVTPIRENECVQIKGYPLSAYIINGDVKSIVLGVSDRQSNQYEYALSFDIDKEQNDNKIFDRIIIVKSIDCGINLADTNKKKRGSDVMKKKSKIKKSIFRSGPIIAAVISIIMLVSVLAADYFNLPTKLGIDTSSLNPDVWSIVLGIIATLLIFLLTYSLIEKHQVRQNENRLETAKVLLNATYCECIASLDMLKKNGDALILVRQYKAANNEGNRYTRFEDEPFENYQAVLQICSEGGLSKELLKEYLLIKQLFQGYVSAFLDAKPDSAIRKFEDSAYPELLNALKQAQKHTS